MDSITGWIIAACTVISLVIAGATAYLKLTLKLGLAQLRANILDDIRKEYADKEQTERRFKDIESHIKILEQGNGG